MILYLASKEGEVEISEESVAPKSLFPVVRRKSDLQALNFLLEGDEPTIIPCRVKKIRWVSYGIVDASGSDFGTDIHIGDDIQFRYGQWTTASREKSSNYRELCNLVNTLEDLCEKGKLKDCELFLFADNLVAEYAYYKCSSSSRTLFELVLRTRKLQMAGELILHVAHIAGARIQTCGVDVFVTGKYF